MPQDRQSCRMTRASSVATMMGVSGRKRLTMRPRSPSPEATMMSLVSTSRTSTLAISETASSTERASPRRCSTSMSSSVEASVSRTILAMISTASTGYLPPAVSPESITASAWSMTALATSETSARVGRGLRIIESSICVATMTGLATSRHLAMSRFCAIGTAAASVSMPRSPRATMMASTASTMASRFSSASRFSILAMMRMGASCFRSNPGADSAALMSARRSPISLAERTKESAMKSTCCPTPKTTSALSFSVMGETVRCESGKFTPLWDVSMPPSIISQTTSRPFTSSTLAERRPSSSRMRSPAFTSSCSFSYVTGSLSAGMSASPVVKTTFAPLASWTPSFGRSPTRILGPWRSCRMATGVPSSSETARILRMSSAWSS